MDWANLEGSPNLSRSIRHRSTAASPELVSDSGGRNGPKMIRSNFVAQSGPRPRLTVKPSPLLLASGHACFLNTSNQFGSGNAHRFTDSEKEINRGRLFVVFELADVTAVDLRRRTTIAPASIWLFHGLFGVPRRPCPEPRSGSQAGPLIIVNKHGIIACRLQDLWQP